MSVTPEERAKAQKVVDASKRTAHVDTGRLKRSIDVKIQRGGLVFRQYFYGIYGKKGDPNSDLVENARKMMGSTPYTIELLDEEGQVTSIDGTTGLGRTIKTNNAKAKVKERQNNAKNLINKVIEQRKKDGEDNGDKDNRKRT